ncbi:MAG TPA: hypothetical protein PLR41_19890 [Alphaproteobacteria bacterium]|nr:hypothetical protein [Alphaproteobacteria bacterium]
MFKAIAVAGALICAGCAAAHQPAVPAASGAAGTVPARVADANSLTGKYRVERRLATGAFGYDGEAFVVPRGTATYDLYWYRYRAPGRMGLGLRSETLLGAAYHKDTSDTTGLGIVIYKVAGGSLDGIRLTDSSPDGVTGKERLEGSADLQGSYTIVESANAFGASNYAGHVEISNRGGRYLLQWFAPDLAYSGIGVRIGDRLVVAFSAEREPPGLLVYCLGAGAMTGLGTAGFGSVLEQQHLRRRDLPDNGAAFPDCQWH